MSSIAQYLNCAICEELSACRYSISYLKWCYFKNVSFYLILWESEDMMFLQLGREQLLKIFSKQHCNYEDEVQIHAVILSIEGI